MLKQADLKIGDKVHYQPEYFNADNWENGIVKEIPTHTTNCVRVVYNCDEEWDNYMNYTSALTQLSDLKLGWR